MNGNPALATAYDSLLLVIDPQEKLVMVNMIRDCERVIGNISMLLRFAFIFDLPVLLTEHYPERLGYCMEEVRWFLPAYQPMRKHIFSCFGIPEISRVLSEMGRNLLLVTGIETHICVTQTVLDAPHNGYRVMVAADAVGTRKPLDHEVALVRMRQLGAAVSISEAMMYEVAERDDTEEFKRLLELVK
ncbi:MAG: isochorismatase family protein [Actinomycetota bacterium]|nr:isochorismatase family protein [Actinomycetota bacterium]